MAGVYAACPACGNRKKGASIRKHICGHIGCDTCLSLGVFRPSTCRGCGKVVAITTYTNIGKIG
jgi:hypothetical protein